MDTPLRLRVQRVQDLRRSSAATPHKDRRADDLEKLTLLEALDDIPGQMSIFDDQTHTVE